MKINLERKEERINKTYINNQGLEMRIVKYTNASNVDVQFNDGYVVKGVQYATLLKGQVLNKNHKTTKTIKDNKNRIGEESVNSQGVGMRIIEYNSSKDITVEFTDGYKTKTKYNAFKRGWIKDYYHKTYCGVGYIGDIKKDFKYSDDKSYTIWYEMIKRVYSDSESKSYTSYKDCEVCEEWHNYSNFKKWYDENYYEVDDEKMDIDKDILVKGNRIYSPNTCMFVPKLINIIFVNKKSKTNLPIGVTWNKSNNKYESKISIKGGRVYLGVYDDEEEAFNAYKRAKETYIKQVADEYRSRIPKILYDAMYNWEVEIND